ncbi:unnamed protein product [Rangifer tarandus platyrhynchus]|uniref:Uncharacterized protein n=1 Tax=Rangifer tarandus platyrhynchus TaxID=3082113 RepID=A0AC59Y9H0_RANTA
MCVSQSCPNFATPWIIYSPPGSSVHGIFQVRILEWVAISYSRGSSQPKNGNLSLVSPALAGGFSITAQPGKPKDGEGRAQQRSLWTSKYSYQVGLCPLALLGKMELEVEMVEA